MESHLLSPPGGQADITNTATNPYPSPSSFEVVEFSYNTVDSFPSSRSSSICEQADTTTDSTPPSPPYEQLEDAYTSIPCSPSVPPQLESHIPITGDGPNACCPYETAFASLSLHKSDRIRLLQFPAEDIIGVREVINHFWPQKVHSEREYAASYEFRFKGHPWSAQGHEAVPARIVMREIFAYLYSVGWILHVTTDVSKKEFDKDTLIFRNQGKPPPKADWISISFNKANRLRLIGADEDLIAAFKLLMKNMRLWDHDGWKEECNNAFEMRLHDHPWVATGEDTVTTRALLLKMLETLEHHGWSVYSSLDQSNGHGHGTPEADSWYCLRRQDWQRGNVVYHR